MAESKPWLAANAPKGASVYIHDTAWDSWQEMIVEGRLRRETPPMPEAQAHSPVGVEAGMRALLARRSAELERGATSVGWKIGFNTPAIQAHFGISGAVVGYITDTTVMASPRAGPGPAATAAAKDTDPRNPPTLCGHMLLKQVM